MIATTCIPFNMFLAAAMSETATMGQMKRGIGFVSTLPDAILFQSDVLLVHPLYLPRHRHRAPALPGRQPLPRCATPCLLLRREMV